MRLRFWRREPPLCRKCRKPMVLYSTTIYEDKSHFHKMFTWFHPDCQVGPAMTFQDRKGKRPVVPPL